jgi:hypothetical protein
MNVSATKRPGLSDEERQRMLEMASKCNGSQTRVAEALRFRHGAEDPRTLIAVGIHCGALRGPAPLRPLTVAEIRALTAKLPPFKG